ncbi:phage tail family protein [Bacillus sp. A301a_S52]|nr:phage tail family protein [Bacillus sp. A301a_S52]
MFKLIYTNSANQSIELYEAPYRLINVEGLGGTEVDVQTQKSPYQDGSTYVDSVLENKSIEIQIKITGNDESDLTINRRKISSIFSPNLGMGVLRFINDEGEKEIDVVVEAVPFFPDGSTNRQRTFQKALIHLQAPDPYWRDPVEVSRELKAYEGTFTFSFTFPTQFGIESDTTTLMNTGHTKAPVRIEVKGPIRRPLIENLTTGKHIQINAIVNPDQTLIIDTKPTNKRVLIKQGDETRNVMGWFDQAGDFWELALGENEIRYRADAGVAEAVATIRWQNKYVGV